MRELMAPPIPFPDLDHIKKKILMEAVRLFALKGYGAVSVRDISKAVNIHPSAVYKRFPSKFNIMESIMQETKLEIQSFYDMLDRLSQEAESFSQIIGNIFVETVEVANPFSFYAIYCAMVNQYLLECCRHVYYDIYFFEGHMVIQRQLRTAIQRGLVAPFDVEEVATTMTNCFVSMIGLNVGQMNGFFEDFDPGVWYRRQKEHVLKITGVIDGER